jgi:hypothetical protein
LACSFVKVCTLPVCAGLTQASPAVPAEYRKALLDANSCVLSGDIDATQFVLYLLRHSR